MRTVTALLSLSLAACATATRSKEPAAQIPANWIDLPGAPFVARIVGRKAVLVNRSNQTYTMVTTGCIVNDAGKVRVLWQDLSAHIFDSSWKPGAHVEGLLRLDRVEDSVAIQPCDPKASTAVTSVWGPGGYWRADGTAWPRRY